MNEADLNATGNPGLLEIIRSQIAPSAAVNTVDAKSLHYAMYVRKSTESEDRQVQSIPDQIRDCIELVVKPNMINFNPSTDVFKEEKSAKEAGTRTEFRRMMSMIEDGKYDGIIAWHYDRLARNMKEAGEIIDLIDRGIIKDLKLAKASFENTPNGKMVLGISFVLSKHYSDHLSESVLRGTNSSTRKGLVLRSQVHGYKITEDKRLVADGRNYELIQEAFKQRLAGKSLKEIAQYLNDNRYEVYRRKTGHSLRRIDVDAISKILKEPVYAGIYAYGTEVVSILDSDQDFSPMITEQEYMSLNGNKIQLSYIYKKSISRKAPNNVSNFLRGIVTCDECGKTMGTSITTKFVFRHTPQEKKQAYFRFVCRTRTCPNKNTGPRGAVVIDYVLDFLDQHIFTTKSNYTRYRSDAELSMRLQLVKLSSFNKKLTTEVSRKRREYDDARAMAADSSSPYAAHYTPEYLETLRKDLTETEKQLKDIRSRIDNNSGMIKSYDEYLKLFGNVADLLRSTTGLGLSDGIIKIFFSNFTVSAKTYGLKQKQKQWSITDHCLCEPFDDFVKNGDFLSWSG